MIETIREIYIWAALVIGKKIWRNVRNREHNGLAGHKE
jgi:hypothetical protein